MIREIFFLAIFGIALAARSADKYIDNAIQTALPSALRSLNLNPAILPQFNIQFGSPYVYTATFYQGNATGFTQVKRKSSCSGPKMNRGELTINCTLKLYPVVTDYQVSIRNATYSINTRSQGRLSETVLNVVIAGHPQNYIGSVKSFQIAKFGAVTTSFPDLPKSLKKYAKSLETVYKTNVSGYLYNIVQQHYVYALGRAIAYIPMPRQ